MAKICSGCGIKYLTYEQRQGGGNAVTFSIGECCECGNDGILVTSDRHYNYRNKENK